MRTIALTLLLLTAGCKTAGKPNVITIKLPPIVYSD